MQSPKNMKKCIDYNVLQTIVDELQLTHVLIVVFVEHVCMCNYLTSSTLRIAFPIFALQPFKHLTLIFEL